MWESVSGENERKTSLTGDDLPKRLNDLRGFLEKHPGGRSLAAALPAKGHWALRLDASRVKLHP